MVERDDRRRYGPPKRVSVTRYGFHRGKKSAHNLIHIIQVTGAWLRTPHLSVSIENEKIEIGLLHALRGTSTKWPSALSHSLRGLQLLMVSEGL